MTVHPDQSILASRDGVPLSIEVQRIVQAKGHAGAVRLRSESGRHRRREWMTVAVHGSGQVPLQVQLHATRSGYIGAQPDRRWAAQRVRAAQDARVVTEIVQTTADPT